MYARRACPLEWTPRRAERRASHWLAPRSAHDVRSALAAIDARVESGLAPFDVVLCDLHLGTCSAKDLYAELQRRSDDLHRHFVVITGAVTSPDDPFAATLGDRYVSKTAPIVALRETLLRNVPPRSAAAAA